MASTAGAAADDAVALLLAAAVADATLEDVTGGDAVEASVFLWVAQDGAWIICWILQISFRHEQINVCR